MRAVVVNAPGGFESLVVAQVPDPVPQPGEVVVEIPAAGVNRADLLQRAGHYPPPPGAPAWPGLEVSGVVVALGPDVAPPDGGGWRVGQQVAALLDEVRPGLVVTFGPEGVTGHPDHQAVSTWVTAAWQATGRKAALWYATLAPDYYRDWGELSDRLGIWVGPERPCTPHDRLAHSLRCTGRLLNRKRRALAAHASQTAALRELVGPAVFDQWWSREWFVAGA